MRLDRRLSRAIVSVLLLCAIVITAPAVRGDRALASAAAVPDACGSMIRKADGSSWKCTFVDNFTGKVVDASKWGIQDTPTTGFRMGPTCFRSARNSVAQRAGFLYLTAASTARQFTCDSPYGGYPTRYTGGMVSSWGKFSQTYGRFEARAKYPTARQPGVHGGFWLYPQKRIYGAWPLSGEIDIAEWWSSAPDLVLPTLHYPGSTFTNDSGWECTVEDVSVFHKYAAEWSPSEMRFYIDGTLCFSRVWTPLLPLLGPQPFDHPFNIALTMAVSGSPASNQVTSATELPATYVIDYVKVWE